MSWKKIRAKYDGTCASCHGKIKRGEEVYWNPETHVVTHLGCWTETTEPEPPKPTDEIPIVQTEEEPPVNAKSQLTEVIKYLITVNPEKANDIEWLTRKSLEIKPADYRGARKANVAYIIKQMNGEIKPYRTPDRETFFIPSGNEVEAIEYSIRNVKNTLLVGPTACGKTTLIEVIAKKKGKKIYTVSCDIELDKSELVGHYEVKDGSTVWVEGIVPFCMKNGHWLVFDEINAAKPEVLTVLNSALDHRRRLIIKEHENEVVEAHPDYRVFATMNPNYIGMMELNEAFRRRFQVVIKMDYLETRKEKKLLMRKTGIDKNMADILVKIANDSRVMHEKGRLSKPLSTAHIIEMADMIMDGFEPRVAATFTLNTGDDNEEQIDIMNIVKNYFGGG